MESERAIFLGCSEAQRNFGGCTGNPSFLTVGAIYDVEKVEIHGYHTKVWLVGIEGSFNSVCFKDVEED